MENQMSMCCGNSKYGKIIVAALAIALTAYVLVLAVNQIKSSRFIGRDVNTQSTINVSGDGDVSVKPDLAVMDFSVVSEGKTVGASMDDNTKKMNAIVSVVKSLGVADNDLQTSGFNITPRYDYVKQTSAVTPAGSPTGTIIAVPDSSISYPSGVRVLSGYDITQTLTVKMRGENMSKIGQIIEEATASGANQVGDLQFTIDNPDAVQAQARQKAIDIAKAKAKVLADQLGVRLVRIISFSEGGYYPVATQMNFAAKDAAAGGTPAAAPSIQTGENKVTVNVNIAYEIE